MDYLNISTNLTIFKQQADICLLKDNQYSVECLNKWFCPQIPNYMVNTGIIILAVSLAVSWLLWWFLNHGYKHIDYENSENWFKEIFGDFRNLETRIYWDFFVRDKLFKLCIGFIAIMTYFYWKM